MFGVRFGQLQFLVANPSGFNYVKSESIEVVLSCTQYRKLGKFHQIYIYKMFSSIVEDYFKKRIFTSETAFAFRSCQRTIFDFRMN